MHDLKIFTENVDAIAINQIYTLIAQAPFLNSKVRIMPDVHVGTGCVVGFTATVNDKIIPSVIGVDIGCGMLCVNMGKIDANFESLDNFIRENIPYGSNFAKEVDGEKLVKSLRCFNALNDFERLYGSLGTLGGGNHFIEVDKDDEDNLYLIIHSGSRNLGKQVATIYQKQAVEYCKTIAEDEKKQAIFNLKEQNLQDKIPEELERISKKYASITKIPAELCYLSGAQMQNYLHDVKICQEFARLNREKMANKILKFLRVFKCKKFETVHNYIDDFNVIRKGAISAKLNEKVLIPMNMRDGCIIAEGIGNQDWNNSAPHGAGRLLSRGDAKNLITLDEYKNSMQGIFTTSVSNGTIDESPMAYKPMQEIINLISPTVKILKIIKPVYNFKAGE